MPYGEVDKIAKMIPTTLNIELEDALKQTPQLESLRKTDERVNELVEVALRLEGLARHASTHAAGVVISPQPLTEIVPLYKSNKDEVTTQYDMNALERIGLLKMDFLGLTTLTVLDDAVRMIKQNRGLDIDLPALPLDDAPSYALFARGDTTGIFQFESHGMRDILKQYQPTRLEDLTALNALYRPGPIQGGMIPDFIARKHGKKKVAYDLPELEEILSETWGVILYQEQVMQIANRLAGFSLGDADLLRRAMGKKKPEEMAAQREKFLTGCHVRKVPAKKAEKIFDLMAEFAGYGFNKSHSCAYALLAYQTAWLKTHFPVEFMAAMLTSETGNTDKVVKFINEARSMSITVLPPDVNSSDVDFTPVGDQIRFGLRAIKNVGENTVKGILLARESLGRFTAFFEFCESVDTRLINKRVLESLVRAGAMDGLGAHRAQMISVIDRAIERAQKLQRAKESGQHGLFGGGSAASAPPIPEVLPDVEEWAEHELLGSEYATLGFYISGHPLDKYAGRLQELKAVELSTIEGRRDGEEIVIAGIIVQSRPMRNRRGERWAILTVQDRTGVIEALVYSAVFQKVEPILKAATPLLIKGRMAVEDGGTRIRVLDVRLLDQVADRPPSRLLVRLELNAVNDSALARLHDLFTSRPGRCRVTFELVKSDGSEATLEASSAVQADKELVERVRDICGADSVAVVQ
jgi:DNA polymerase-3 subunit alpha